MKFSSYGSFVMLTRALLGLGLWICSPLLGGGGGDLDPRSRLLCVVEKMVMSMDCGRCPSFDELEL